MTTDKYLQEGTLKVADKGVGRPAYRVPYIVRACAHAFRRSIETEIPLTRSKLLETLCMEDELLIGQADIVTSPLRLRDKQVNQITSNPSTLFWINLCKWPRLWTWFNT